MNEQGPMLMILKFCNTIALLGGFFFFYEVILLKCIYIPLACRTHTRLRFNVKYFNFYIIIRKIIKVSITL